MKKKKEKEDKIDSGFYGYPIGTLAFYGPDSTFANKVAVGFIESEDAEPEMKVWFSDKEDVRNDRKIGSEITEYLTSRAVKSVVASDGIIGCPHQEGIDYPEGEDCLKCPFWIGKDRFKSETIH
jgi:hypothetical protein